jgi:hypothetical protein
MKPQAYEALQKAKALFRHPAEDDIPANATPVEPIRKPRVVLLPPDAPKFDKESMKQEYKKAENGHPSSAQQTDKYVEMSTTKACEACLKKGITKPSDIAKETGKNVNQIYTALWILKKRKAKAKAKAKEAKRFEFDTRKPTPEFVMPKSLEKVKAVYDENGVNTTNSFNTPPDDFDREPTAYEDRNYVVLRTREDYEEKIDALCMQRNKLEDENKELKTIIKYLEGKIKNV